VYDGEEHWAVFANHCRGVIADVEGGLTPEAKAKAEFIARACNVYRDLVEALDFLLKQTVDLDLANGIGLTDGEREARKKALSALKTANGQAA